MHMIMVGLLAATALNSVNVVEPSEDAMRQAFASDLAAGVNAVLAYIEEMAGTEAVARIREAGNDAFAITGFRKSDCRATGDAHVCHFAVDVNTVAGPLVCSMEGRFFVGAHGLAYDHDA